VKRTRLPLDTLIIRPSFFGRSKKSAQSRLISARAARVSTQRVEGWEVAAGWVQGNRAQLLLTS
jgi:hypothetical protein